MKTKTSYKEISLFEIINDNLNVILAIIHNIGSLYFNHHSIITLTNLKNVQLHLDYYNNFNILETNIKFCQQITILTIFIILYCYKNKRLQDIGIISSWVIKCIYTLYITIYLNWNIWIEEPNDTFHVFGFGYFQIIISFICTVGIFIFCMFILCTAFVIISCYLIEKLINKIIDYCKNTKFKYIKHTIDNEQKEDV
jgi:hypothetical protein